MESFLGKFLLYLQGEKHVIFCKALLYSSVVFLGAVFLSNHVYTLCLYTSTTCPLNLSSLMQPFSLHLYILDPLDGLTIPQFTTHFHTSVPLLKLFLLLQMLLPLCLRSFYLTLRANSYAFVSPITHNQAEFIAPSLICLSYPTLFLSILCWAASSMGAKIVL